MLPKDKRVDRQFGAEAGPWGGSEAQKSFQSQTMAGEEEARPGCRIHSTWQPL